MAKFYRCNHCGNLFSVLHDGKVTPVCCGENMQLLEANTTDAAVEKHVPVVRLERDGHVIRVNVGEADHPMVDEHYIEWIAYEADDRLEVHYLAQNDMPSTFFAGASEHGTIYAYCNLHGLWKKEF